MENNTSPEPAHWHDGHDDFNQEPEPLILCSFCQSEDIEWKYDIFDEDFGTNVGSTFKCNQCGHRFDYY